ncbi:GPI mannosyltransferase 1 [Sitophilus oryzae]|uniref:GPI alpha-1,4-mannosyltransferase I, catalytic subunit n=1 Tax=Sitophilus oryzae TaxID=7048 RepID=A0A6J2XI02_SITOR|nr:GPI mannosyltransferase 1 [Sitophilus oryzae]
MLLLDRFIDLDVITHFIFASLIRAILIVYGIWHDKYSDVPYTDIDYKVFTDASRYIIDGKSPYDRHTFRYSPLISFLLIPNVVIHEIFGKIFFCIFDLVVAYLIRCLVYINISHWLKYYSKDDVKINLQKEQNLWAQRAMLLWLYNPMVVTISTRGNSDSLACGLVILTLYVLQAKRSYFCAGLLHGLSIHFRIYPIIYTMSFLLYLSNFSYYLDCDKNVVDLTLRQKRETRKSIQRISFLGQKLFLYLIPNSHQIIFVLGMLMSWSVLTLTFYFFYEFRFLYESILYHFVRTDFKHNFSLYFYAQYLSAWMKFDIWSVVFWHAILKNLPPLIILLYLSVYFGLNQYTLNFTILCQTIVFVIYNKVLTSQYFVWIMGIVPLCIWQLKFSVKSISLLVLIWILAQGTWLLPAYLLEFEGKNTFIYIWVQSISLFCTHVIILGHLLQNFILKMQINKKTQ